MIIRKAKNFDRFACLAGGCPDTCCGGWAVGIDGESLGRYWKLSGALGNRVKNSIDWEEGCFVQYEGSCGMLEEDGLCGIQKELGWEALCDTCREYPRHVEEYENVREYSLSLSCPEAARMTLEDGETTEFTEEEDGEKEEFEEFDGELFARLKQSREVFLDLLGNRHFSLEKRIDKVVALAAKLQEEIDGDEPDEETLGKAAEGEEKEGASGCKRYFGRKNDFAVFYDMDWLRPEWGGRVERTWEALYARGEEEYQAVFRRFCGDPSRREAWETGKERLLLFYIDLYLCGAVYDGEAFSKAALAVFSVRAIEEFLLAAFAGKENSFRLWEEAARITCQFAREVEHSDDNLLLLEKWAAERIMVQKN